MRIVKICLLLFLATATIQGCVSGRSTTTSQTAVEEALLTQTADAAIAQLDLSGHEGVRYFIVDQIGKISKSEYVLAALHRHLLRAGLVAADSAEQADLLVTPIVGNLAIDDTTSLIGLPAIPLILPAIGTIDLPEAAFFRRHSQFGRGRIGLFAHDAKSGRLSIDTGMANSQIYYKRWLLLFLFDFRTTTLDKPF